jgi:hypothetical protein
VSDVTKVFNCGGKGGTKGPCPTGGGKGKKIQTPIFKEKDVREHFQPVVDKLKTAVAKMGSGKSKKIKIQEAAKVLAEKGLTLEMGRHDLKTGTTFYKITDRSGYSRMIPSEEIKKMVTKNEMDVTNAFCPTGKGGGIDPHCGRSSGGAARVGGPGAGRVKGHLKAKSRAMFTKADKASRFKQPLLTKSKDVVDSGVERVFGFDSKVSGGSLFKSAGGKAQKTGATAGATGRGAARSGGRPHGGKKKRKKKEKKLLSFSKNESVTEIFNCGGKGGNPGPCKKGRAAKPKRYLHQFHSGLKKGVAGKFIIHDPAKSVHDAEMFDTPEAAIESAVKQGFRLMPSRTLRDYKKKKK